MCKHAQKRATKGATKMRCKLQPVHAGGAMQKDMLVVQLFRNGSYGCLPVRSGRTAPAPKGRRGGACLLTSVHEEFLGEVAQLGGPSSWVCSCIPSPTQPGDPWRSVATRAASPGRLVQDAQPQVPAPRVEGEHSGPITARQHHRHRRKKTAALRSRGVRSARATPLACWRRCPGRGRRRCAAARCGLRRGRRHKSARCHRGRSRQHSDLYLGTHHFFGEWPGAVSRLGRHRQGG